MRYVLVSLALAGLQLSAVGSVLGQDLETCLVA